MNTQVYYAPIAIFAYSRVDHLRRTIDSLLKNEESSHTLVYIFCDGPKDVSGKASTDAVRTFAESISGFAGITRIYRETNIGLASSIINGVSYVLKEHRSVIVVEDDLDVSPYFLRFMNEGLRTYQDDVEVASIHGYSYSFNSDTPETYFLRGTGCWGWATWHRAWEAFEADGQVLLNQLQRNGLLKAFDLDGSYPYSKMLKNQIKGRNNSWAIRWHAACFLKNMITLHPGRSLVNNTGFDNSGTHCSQTDFFTQSIQSGPVPVTRIQPIESQSVREKLVHHFRLNYSFKARVWAKLKSLAS